MKYIIEFGNRGGYNTHVALTMTQTEAAKLAAGLVNVLDANRYHEMCEWRVHKRNPRQTWQSSTHFVALSVLDGVPRGDAAATLWKPEEQQCK